MESVIPRRVAPEVKRGRSKDAPSEVDELLMQRSVERYLARFPEFNAAAIEVNMAITWTFLTLNQGLQRFLLPEGLGLNRAQYNFLAVLYLSPNNRLSLNEISREMHVSPAYVTKLLVALEEAGLVDRLANPDDRRVTYAHLTTEGEARCATLIPAFLDFMQEVGRSLTTTEQAELLRLLSKCRERAEAF